MPNQTAIAITSALLLALFEEQAAADPSPCRPTVVLEGEPKIVKNVKLLLKKKGIESTQAPDCPAVQAKLERKDEKFILWMQDPYGRVSERAISDAKSAAALLESWVRTDLTTTSWLIQPEPTSAPASQPTSAPAEAPRQERFYADDPGPSPDDVFEEEPKYKWWQTPDRGFIRLGDGFSIGSEVSFGLSGTSGVGVKATGCKFFGPLCIGTLARMGAFNGANKAFGDVELVVNLPVKIRRLWVTPGVGGGVGWIRRDTLLDDVFLAPGTQQPTTNNSGGVRGELLLHIVTPMSPEFLFEAGGALSRVTTRGENVEDTIFAGEIALTGADETFIRAFIGIRYKIY